MISTLLSQLPPLSHNFTPEIDRLLQNIRYTSQEFLRSAVLPTIQEEEWKYTNVSVLGDSVWQISDSAPDIPIDIPLIPEASDHLVFQNGLFAPDRSVIADHSLDKLLLLGGIAGHSHHKLSNFLAAHLDQSTDHQDIFSHLNACALRDISLLVIPPHFYQPQPIALIFSTSGHQCLSQPRTLIIAEPQSSVTIVEIHTGHNDRYWANPVMEIYLGEDAQLHHLILQQQGHNAFHTANTRVVQSRGSTYRHQAIDYGSQLSRHTLHICQGGPMTQTDLQGLVILKGSQHADTHTTIAHQHPQGKSRQLHKCIVGEAGHAVFSGKIQVAKAAQLTDARQMSRNLLRSPQARVDTKPQLEIVADNVKCTHGATVSQLDPEEQFYLQSRGIDAQIASNLLTYAFAGEILQTIPINSVRDRLQKFILNQI